MAKFARIIELEQDEQVLLTVNYNNEDDNYEVEVRTDLKGITASIKLGFKNEQKALNLMKTYKQEEAVKFRQQMANMFI